MKIKNIISILLCLVMLSSCGEGEKGKEGKESRNRSMESGIREKRDSSNANVSDSALKKNSTPLHK